LKLEESHTNDEEFKVIEVVDVNDCSDIKLEEIVEGFILALDEDAISDGNKVIEVSSNDTGEHAKHTCGRSLQL